MTLQDPIVVLNTLQTFFNAGKTQSLEFRIQALAKLEAMVIESIEPICAALFSDLRKPKQEALISEVAVILEEIRFVKKNLRRWMKPRRASTQFALWPAQSRVYFEPLGVVLVIGPWNYPFQLVMAPLIGALAAGNCAVVKPSELAPHTSRLIAELVNRSFSPDHVQVIEGGIPETTSLLSLDFDHIFFTGSTSVGKIVMQAAAKHLVPVTLELGGKSPVVVCEDADLDLAARRTVWGKFYNAGQTCVAPDYLFVQQSVSEVFVKKIIGCIENQFGVDPQSSQSLSRIVNLKNCERLAKLIDPGKVIYGGKLDLKDLYVGPTVLGNVTWNDAVMQEEIFGPILPVLPFEELEDVFLILKQQPKPLSAYLFSRSKAIQKTFVRRVSFGGGCINDVLVHLSNPSVPFGGVGDSGMGNYHGKNSFQTFSHSKSVMYRFGLFDFSSRYAPYNERKLKFLKRIFRL